MYALIILDELFIFDFKKTYGFVTLKEQNLSDFIKVLSVDEVLGNYQKNHENDVYEVEEYSSFLHKICLMFLKDCRL